MPRITAPVRLAALALALVAPLLTWSVPAHADAPIPSTVSLYIDGGQLEEDTTISLFGGINPVYGHPYAQGTFTYRDDQGTVLGTNTIGVEPYGVTIPKPTQPTTYSVDFHSTNGYADATATKLFTPTYIRTVTVTAEPTILKIGPGLIPTLTLKLGATAKLKNGVGVPGITVYYYAFCPPGPNRTCGVSVPLCDTVTNAQGVATCNATFGGGAILSLLSGVVHLISYQDYGPPGSERFNVVQTSDSPPLIAKAS